MGIECDDDMDEYGSNQRSVADVEEPLLEAGGAKPQQLITSGDPTAEYVALTLLVCASSSAINQPSSRGIHVLPPTYRCPGVLVS